MHCYDPKEKYGQKSSKLRICFQLLTVAFLTATVMLVSHPRFLVIAALPATVQVCGEGSLCSRVNIPYLKFPPWIQA